ncbi:MAG TPA: hypothetical protein ENI85_01735 [Deltaproteobacteria bacterium]|nr:hypothetical protein [Deltaproteobacteria bacterium]
MEREEGSGQGGSPGVAKRIVVFGVTGHLGQQVVDGLDESGWPIAELIGVASPESAGAEFEFRGQMLDVVSDRPVLKGRDLVFICTPASEALGIVREALRAEVPCIDCTGALSDRDEIPIALPEPIVRAIEEIRGDTASGSETGEAASSSGVSGRVSLEDACLEKAPLLAIPSATSLAWTPILAALDVSRMVGTVLCSASAQGHRGIAALSEESIALFNQSASPEAGPAGQAVAFDVVPGGGIDPERVRREIQRLFGSSVRVDLASLQVPAFVGEGASLALELRNPLDRKEVEARLAAMPGLSIRSAGAGSRGLVLVEAGAPEPIGPTLRDAIGVDEVLVGRIQADRSLPEGQGWWLWIAFDPLRLAARHAMALAARRLGLA